MPEHACVRSVDGRGIALLAFDDRPVDVCFDGRRIWTLWTRRDTEAVGGLSASPVRRAAWPKPLTRYLDGQARITVLDSASERLYYDRELLFGSGEGRIEIRDAQGAELGMDKSGKLVATFAGRAESDIAALIDATEAVVAALQETGIEPFLAYGTLLGAVREGRVLGHDSDADLGYVSRFSNPVDVARESFRVQRGLAERGWDTYRYSGGAFRVNVTEGGVTRGLDVFGGFHDRGRLHLMGEIGTEFERDWLYPLGTAVLEGRSMPVPAAPEKLLEATYGPGWKVPDPAFVFTTPERTVRALGSWFRGTQPGIRYWERHARSRPEKGFRPPSRLAQRAAKTAARLDADVLDVGAGRGADSLWLARQGLTVTAYDYVPRALSDARRHAAREGLDMEVRHLNLTEWRSVFAEGARLAAHPRPRVVVARHVLDATSAFGRESLARLCSLALREGGQLLADLHVVEEDEVGEDLPADAPEWMLGRPQVDPLTTLLRGAGATEVTVKQLPGRDLPTVRVVGTWT